MDFRIEKWIYDSFPEIRTEQKKALKEDAQRTLQSASEKIRKITPPSIFTRSNALSYAHLYLLYPITKKKYNKVYYDYPKILKKGKKLTKAVPKEDRGLQGDIELTDKWAEILEIGDWFEWRKF